MKDWFGGRHVEGVERVSKRRLDIEEENELRSGGKKI